MITADCCGAGHSFTVSGKQVAWRTNDDTVLPPFKENVLEAMWSAIYGRRIAKRDSSVPLWA